MDKNDILNEYLRQGSPSARESAQAWKTAIGLQAVDGLKPSPYLIETAQRNIEGDISIDEVQRLLHQYYENKTSRTPEDDEQEECDKASANIKKILSSQTLAFNSEGYIATHRRIFEGVFKHAGTLRTFDITKKEFILGGDTVIYLSLEDLRRAIDYDIQQEKDFSYRGLNDDEKIKHLCRFTAGLWQIHPFCEGNTRTTAVFLIQYLRSIGYKAIGNDMFADHSWYFRNALVRANYRNQSLGVDYDLSFLEKFFRNLLLGETNELKNRYMILNADFTESNQKSNQKSDQKILSLISNNSTVTIRELVMLTGLSESGVKKILRKLKKDGIIRRVGPDKGGHWEIIR